MTQTEMIICKTKMDLDKAYGKKCYVIGTYDIKTFRSKKNIVIAEWPVICLSDSTDVLLGSFWHHENTRSPDEKKELVGKKIKATGLLHDEPPTEPGSQNIAIPCLDPVIKLEV